MPTQSHENEFELSVYTPIIGGIENDIPSDYECQMDDLDAQIEDECLESIWAV